MGTAFNFLISGVESVCVLVDRTQPLHLKMLNKCQIFRRLMVLLTFDLQVKAHVQHSMTKVGS